jgi:hypothetical protein
MSTDKIQALEEALAEVFSEPYLISTNTNTEQSSPVFDHAALAGIFSEPLPFSTSTTPSPPSFDHQALAEMFSEPPLVSIDPQPSPLSFDTWSSSPPLFGQLDNGEPEAKAVAVAPSTNAESARPQRAESLLAKLRNVFSIKAEPPSSSIEKDSSPPSLTAQKLELMANAILAASPIDTESVRPQQTKSPLTELSPLISTNSELPSLNLEQEPWPPRLSGQPGNVRPAASDAAATSPAGSESARPTSLLAETSSLISTTEPSPPMIEENSSQPTVAGRLDNVDPGVKAATPADTENARPEKAKSLLTELRTLISASTEPPPSVEKQPSRLTLSGRVGNVEPVAKTHSPPTDAESARAQQARSLQIEPLGATSTTEPSPPIFEKEPSRPILSGRLDNVEPAEKTDVESAQPQTPNSSRTELPPLISANTKPPPPISETEPSQPVLAAQQDNLAANAAPTDAESAGARQAKSFPAELAPLISIDTETSSVIREKETSRPTLAGQPDNVEPAAEIVAAASPIEMESARPQRAKSLLAEPPPLISTDTKPSPPDVETEPSPPTLSGQLDNVGPAASTVAAVPPTNAESTRPQRATSLPAELPPTISTNAKSPLPILEKDLSRPTLPSQLNDLEPAAKTVSVAPLTDAQSTLPTQAKPLQAEKLLPVSTNAKPSSLSEEAPSRPSVYSRLDNVQSAVRAVAVSPPPTTDGAVTRAQQAKSLLAELDLDTAIRLRWVMRDIRGKRTAISPAGENDLATLIDLGLVEMREKLPSLTALGLLELD